jgi:transposase
MRKDVEVRLGPGDRERLEAVLADRNSAQKHAWRARIILATAAGCGTAEIMRRAGVSKPCVWRWQRRFMEAGVDGLLRDKTRKPGKAPVAPAMVARLLELTLGAPPGETTHWTSRAMGKVTGLAISTVQKIWRAHGLATSQPLLEHDRAVRGDRVHLEDVLGEIEADRCNLHDGWLPVVAADSHLGTLMP